VRIAKKTGISAAPFRVRRSPERRDASACQGDEGCQSRQDQHIKESPSDHRDSARMRAPLKNPNSKVSSPLGARGLSHRARTGGA
jgi:hypothetical protein